MTCFAVADVLPGLFHFRRFLGTKWIVSVDTVDLPVESEFEFGSCICRPRCRGSTLVACTCSEYGDAISTLLLLVHPLLRSRLLELGVLHRRCEEIYVWRSVEKSSRWEMCCEEKGFEKVCIEVPHALIDYFSSLRSASRSSRALRT